MLPVGVIRFVFFVAILCLLYSGWLIWKSLPDDEEYFDDPGIGE